VAVASASPSPVACQRPVEPAQLDSMLTWHWACRPAELVKQVAASA